MTRWHHSEGSPRRRRRAGRFGLAAAVAVVLGPGSAGARELLPECDWSRAVKQASLYREEGQLGAARGELEMVLSTDRGTERAEVWLAFALVTYEQGDLAAAGTAMERLYRLNESGALEGELPGWGERFIERYEASVGQIVLEDAEPRLVAFSAGYESGGYAEMAERLLERESGVMVRASLSPIHLPPGVYRLGEARVEVRPGSGRPGVVPLTSLGDPKALESAARSAPRPEPFAVVPSPYLERCKERSLPPGVLASGTPVAESGFMDGAWPWVLGGLVVVGAGAAAAAVALHEPDWRLRFDGEAP